MNIKIILILTAILLLAALLRFYRLPEMAPLDFDQEYAANFAYNILRVYPIQLIGQGLSIQGLFMGPWYFYYLVPFFAASNLHPIGGFVGSVIFSLFIIFTYFWVGKSLFGVKAGLIAAFIRSILFTEIRNDLSMAPAYASELLILITWWLFYKYWQGKTKYFPLLFFIFGLYTSIHPILFPFYIVFLILFLIKRRLPNTKTLFISFISFLIPIIPLIIFEYFHNFLEVKLLFNTFSSSPLKPDYFSNFIKYLSFNLGEPQRIIGFNFILKDTFVLLFFGIIFILIVKRVGFWKESFHKILLTVTYVVFLIYYTLFPAHVPEYYFQALTTLCLLYISANLVLLTKKPYLLIILILLLGNIVYYNFSLLINKWNNPSLSNLYQKDFIVQEILKRQPQNEEFYVSYIKLPGWNFGFEYLFKYYGHIPQTKEAKPPVFTIVVPRFLSEQSINISAGNIGLILPVN